jgi:hypothetical protein
MPVLPSIRRPGRPLPSGPLCEGSPCQRRAFVFVAGYVSHVESDKACFRVIPSPVDRPAATLMCSGLGIAPVQPICVAPLTIGWWRHDPAMAY